MLQPHSKAHPSTSSATNSNDASWTEPDELPGEPKNTAERSANGSSSKEDTVGEVCLRKGTFDELESPLSVGAARFRFPIARTHHTQQVRAGVLLLGFSLASCHDTAVGPDLCVASQVLRYDLSWTPVLEVLYQYVCDLR